MHSDRGDELALRSLDFVEDPEQLRADALAQLDAVGGRNYQPPPYEEAGDSTDTVRVAVDRAGAVIDVHFRSDWQSQLTSSELGTALLEAHRNAGVAMANSLALGALAAEERARVEGDAAPAEPKPLPDVPIPDIWEIWQKLSAVEDLMYRAGKASREAREERTIQSMWGLMTATCAGRVITSVSVEPMLARQADTERLRSAAMELFREAGQLTGGEHL